MKLYRIITINGRKVTVRKTDYECCNASGAFVTLWTGDDGKAYEKRGGSFVRFSGWVA